MDFINPTITIQNAVGADWLFSMTHVIDGPQTVSFTIAIPKSSASLGELQRQAVAKVVEVLSAVEARLAASISGKPGPASSP